MTQAHRQPTRPNETAVGPGGVDWEARWRRLVREREAQTDALQFGAVRPGSDFWERRAGWFAAATTTRRDPADDPLLARLLPTLRPEWTVLDVGAGAGRHTIPLARFVQQVVAVEPSAALADHLAARVAAEGLTNVRLVRGSWEAAAVEPADIAICANVLYPIAEAGAFLRKLHRHARHAVWVVQRALAAGGLHDELWRLIRGEPRRPEPTLFDLYNLLGQLGIVADVATATLTPSLSWPSLDEAVADALDRLVLPEDAPEVPRVRQFLGERLHVVDGRFTVPLAPWHVGIVTWRPAEFAV